MKKNSFLQIVGIGLLVLIINIADAQEFKVRGRLHMDAFYGISDADKFSNGFNNRRARIGTTGKINDNWDGIIEFDFANTSIEANDVRLRRSFSNGGKLLIGQYKVAQGLNQLSSSNDMTFIERSMVSNIIPDARRMGVGYEYFKENKGFNVMMFGRNIGQRASIEKDMPLGGVVRLVYAPKIGESILHIASSFVYEDRNSNKVVSYGDRPESRDCKGGSIKLIDIKVPDANNTFKAGAELAYINGPLSFEAEYLQVALNTVNGINPSFFGWHVQTAYVLTGESRSYKSGIMGTVTPEGEKGAWEIAVRYSFVNLNNTVYLGGEQANITFGVNKYVTSKLRFMANIIYVNLDYSDDNPILGVLRAQYNF